MHTPYSPKQEMHCIVCSPACHSPHMSNDFTLRIVHPQSYRFAGSINSYTSKMTLSFSAWNLITLNFISKTNSQADFPSSKFHVWHSAVFLRLLSLFPEKPLKITVTGDVHFSIIGFSLYVILSYPFNQHSQTNSRITRIALGCSLERINALTGSPQ